MLNTVPVSALIFAKHCVITMFKKVIAITKSPEHAIGSTNATVNVVYVSELSM